MNLEARTGLAQKDLSMIREAAAALPAIETLVLFGSRAKGNYRKGSDVDLAVKGDTVDDRTIAQLNDQLNEVLPLPYFFDVLNFHTIAEPELKSHIDRVGLVIFNKSP